MKVGLPLMKNVLMALAKSVLISSGLMIPVSATDVAIQKKIHKSGMATLIISGKEMKDTKGKMKSLEESSLSIKGLSKTIGN